MNFIQLKNVKGFVPCAEKTVCVNPYVASIAMIIFGENFIHDLTEEYHIKDSKEVTYCKCPEDGKIYAVIFVAEEPLMWKEAIKKEDIKYSIVFNISFDNEKKVIPKLKEMSFEFCDFSSLEEAKNMTLPLLKGVLAQNATGFVSGVVEIMYEKYDANEKSLSTEYVDSDTSNFTFTKKKNFQNVLNIDF